MAIAPLTNAKISYIDSGGKLENTPDQLDNGNGKLPVMMVHGFASNKQTNWVDTQWVSFLTDHGYRVIALDNRGHGASEKFYESDDYQISKMAGDAIELLNYLEIPKAIILGYSMGARIGTSIALQSGERVEKLILGGNGYGMIEGVSGWEIVQDGLLADSLADVSDEKARAFRKFADHTKSDRRALAACVIGTRQLFSEQDFKSIYQPALIAIGGKDDIAGSGEKLCDLMPNAKYLEITNRDHMRAVGDKIFKNGVLDFLQS